MITVDEYRYSRRKTLSVSIDIFGKVIVRAPKGYSRQKIDAFIEKKAAWIEKHKASKAQNAAMLPTQIDGYELPYLGNKLQLCVQPIRRVIFDGERLLLPMENPEKSLLSWLKRQARELLLSRTIYWQEKMGVACKSVAISSAKRKWGSCSSRDEIRYAYRLIYAPMELIDYVVVHELAHIRYKNHSQAFWQEVKRHMPDCLSRRARLQRNAVFLEIF